MTNRSWHIRYTSLSHHNEYSFVENLREIILLSLHRHALRHSGWVELIFSTRSTFTALEHTKRIVIFADEIRTRSNYWHQRNKTRKAHTRHYGFFNARMFKSSTANEFRDADKPQSEETKIGRGGKESVCWNKESRGEERKSHSRNARAFLHAQGCELAVTINSRYAYAYIRMYICVYLHVT